MPFTQPRRAPRSKRKSRKWRCTRLSRSWLCASNSHTPRRAAARLIESCYLFFLRGSELPGRTSVKSAEQRAERRQTLKSNFQANLRYRALRGAEQVAGGRQPPPLQILIRSLAEHFAKKAVKMRGQKAGYRPHFVQPQVSAEKRIQVVLAAQQAPVKLNPRRQFLSGNPLRLPVRIGANAPQGLCHRKKLIFQPRLRRVLLLHAQVHLAHQRTHQRIVFVQRLEKFRARIAIPIRIRSSH